MKTGLYVHFYFLAPTGTRWGLRRLGDQSGKIAVGESCRGGNGRLRVSELVRCARCNFVEYGCAVLWHATP
jgi:hypothetical protein